VREDFERALFHYAIEMKLFEAAGDEPNAAISRALRGALGRALPPEAAVRARPVRQRNGIRNGRRRALWCCAGPWPIARSRSDRHLAHGTSWPGFVDDHQHDHAHLSGSQGPFLRPDLTRHCDHARPRGNMFDAVNKHSRRRQLVPVGCYPPLVQHRPAAEWGRLRGVSQASMPTFVSGFGEAKVSGPERG
jgi:hypothetical protein